MNLHTMHVQGRVAGGRGKINDGPKESRLAQGVTSEWFLYCCSPIDRNLAKLKHLFAYLLDNTLGTAGVDSPLPFFWIPKILYLFDPWERAPHSCDSDPYSSTIPNQGHWGYILPE